MTDATKPGVPPGPADASSIVARAECSGEPPQDADRKSAIGIARPRQDAVGFKVWECIALLMIGFALIGRDDRGGPVTTKREKSLPAGQRGWTIYYVRNADGELIAEQHRTGDGPNKKILWKNAKTGQWKLGFPSAELPLFGAEKVRSWPMSAPIVVTEGPKAAAALHALSIPAVGTLTGAAGLPCDESLAVLDGRIATLWPDADEAGIGHMWAVYARLWRAQRVFILSWPDAPYKGDAADATEPQIRQLLADPVDAGIPEEPGEPEPATWSFAKDGPIQRFNDEVPVADVLREFYGVIVEVGKTTYCVGHDDHRPSMSVFVDKRGLQRVFCHSGGDCPMYNDGHGRDAWGLYQLAEGVQRANR